MALSKQILNLPFESYDLFTINPSFNLNASVNSNLTLQYESQNNNVINVSSNGLVTIIGPGRTLVKIYNNGNAVWEPIEKFVLINISKKSQEIFFFPLENKYVNDPNFSLNAYTSSSSGLPIKYKSLTPNVAIISEDGKVVISGPGRAIFEAYQEGNFEWNPVKIINEFGVSLQEYPFTFELTSENPNTLIKVNLYKNQDQQLRLVDNNLSFSDKTLLNIKSISGGLYFGSTKYSLKQDLILPTGEYIGLINYEYIESGVTSFNLNSYYSFSKEIYSGSYSNKAMSFQVIRTGFINYGVDLIVHGIFDDTNGYKYASKLALESGIFWSGSFSPNESGLTFTLPIFYSNKVEKDVNGKLKLYFMKNTNMPKELTQLGSFPESNFLITSGSISDSLGLGINPYFPKDLGIDFLNFRPAAFSNSQNYPPLN